MTVRLEADATKRAEIIASEAPLVPEASVEVFVLPGYNVLHVRAGIAFDNSVTWQR